MEIRLTDYSDEWNIEFEREVVRLKRIFSTLDIHFEHFGSTSVKGMKAKPVIDMIGIVQCIDDLEPFHEQLHAEGYDVAGEWGIEGRMLYRKGGENRTHHIHMYQFDNTQIERHLVVRDYLRSNPAEVEMYNLLKIDLSSKYNDTRDYSRAKKEYVNKLEKRAYDWYLSNNF
ncbi:GrpB family protein [Psychrobacillus sp. INOP01]|uniref:GrpB family protein n=1 Tax=Psychrobacillus sp. INOP01 TaxID=2829187 RepID=UPI001BA60F53|nr:GrpB family protein [Psychrobacillus sp. INOP01]QUG42495.1 GrpB family protein [Psychrobacillus sp. INOP01]